MKQNPLPRLRAALAGAVLAATSHAALAADTVVYDAIPSPQPGNVPSLGFEARSMVAVGDVVQLGAGERTLRSFDVLMSSWACVEGTWNGGNCATPPGATFEHPITVDLLSEDQTQVLASATKVFEIPFRPSANPECGDGRWKDANGVCNNGFGHVIRYSGADFGNLVLPERFLYRVSYNTRSHGPQPTGVPGPADSLNVGLRATATYGQALAAGSDPNGSTAIWQQTKFGGFYCDNGAGGINVFRLDAGCWTQQVAVRVTTTTPPVAATLSGFRAPVDATPVLNTANSALAVPLRFTVRRADGSPVTDLASVNVSATTVACDTLAISRRDRVEQVALSPGRLINQFGGNYQFNFGVDRGTTGCRVVTLSLPAGYTSTPASLTAWIEYLR